MKEPREILLARHRSAQRQLDVIRQAALEEFSQPAAAAPVSPTQPSAATRFTEWLFPLRRHLIGLGLAWVMIALLNLTNSPTAATAQPNTTQNLSSRSLWLALREHQRQLREWTQPSATATATAPPGVPQSMVPPRRSRSATIA